MRAVDWTDYKTYSDIGSTVNGYVRAGQVKKTQAPGHKLGRIVAYDENWKPVRIGHLL